MTAVSGVESFFKKVGGELARLFGNTTWEQTAVSTINYAAPIVETIAQLVAGTAAASAIASVLNTVKADLATVSAVVKGAQVAKGSTASTTVRAALSSIVNNLSGLLSMAEVKNSAKAADITAAVQLLSNEATEMLQALPA